MRDGYFDTLINMLLIHRSYFDITKMYLQLGCSTVGVLEAEGYKKRVLLVGSLFILISLNDFPILPRMRLHRLNNVFSIPDPRIAGLSHFRG